MLDCKLCNFYQAFVRDRSISYKGTARCELTDVIFMDDVENLDIEYPCRHVSLSDYLKRKQEPEVQKRKDLLLA